MSEKTLQPLVDAISLAIQEVQDQHRAYAAQKALNELIERLRRIEDAAGHIKHWHDHVFPDGAEGMVVSAISVRALWRALEGEEADA